jgi:hypothetical protein
MRRNLAVGSAVAAGGLALALVATPVWASASSWMGLTRAATCAATGQVCPTPGTPGSGHGMNGGMGYGMRGGATGATGAAGPTGSVAPGYGRNGGMMGNGQMGGGMMNADDAVQGTLTADQRTALVGMADEEKMAHDLYVALGATYPADTQFARIAQSETMHLTAVRTLLTRHGISDPTADLPAGRFATARIQSLYDGLLAGATTSSAALAAGVTVERTDIADLDAATAGVTAPDVLSVYAHLRMGSQHHLAAFGG